MGTPFATEKEKPQACARGYVRNKIRVKAHYAGVITSSAALISNSSSASCIMGALYAEGQHLSKELYVTK
jgi:hypothetical protein